jgi:hypothetical protein
MFVILQPRIAGLFGDNDVYPVTKELKGCDKEYRSSATAAKRRSNKKAILRWLSMIMIKLL